MKTIALLLFAMSVSTSYSLADEPAKGDSPMDKMAPMTTDQRHKMADAHEQMAACLRTDKPMKECHEAMMKSCQDTLGKDGCPMMGGRGKGMHHGKMMHQDEAGSPAK